jgi:hypothetical protein
MFFVQSMTNVTPHDISATYDPREYSTKPVNYARGSITGELLDPDGKPMPQTDMQITSTVKVPPSINGFHQTTDDQGQFKFEVPPGRYILAINLYTGPSQDLPYDITYFPGTTDVAHATEIRLKADQHVDHVTQRLSAAKRLHERKFSGKVEWPDGRMAFGAAVWLSEDQNEHLVMRSPGSHADDNGNFTLTGFNGKNYFVHAKVNLAGKPVCAEKLRVNSTAPSDAINLKLTVEGLIPCIQQ